jgi:hypothetical protein
VLSVFYYNYSNIYLLYVSRGGILVLHLWIDVLRDEPAFCRFFTTTNIYLLYVSRGGIFKIICQEEYHR